MHRLEEAVSIEEAIRLHTRESAYFTFDENEKGTIAEGMLVDFVVLSDDILGIPQTAVRDLGVALTFNGGQEFSR